MTREEAYNRIDAIIAKHEIDDVYVTITNFMDYDALRIARKTLEQEPCEDCISRKAVLIAIYNADGEMDSNFELDRSMCNKSDLADVIEDLPSIQPTAKENLVVEDAISRQAVDRLAMRYLREPTDKHVAFYEEFIALPPVTPKPKTDVLDKIRAEINSPNRGTCDYFIVDRIEEIIDKYKAEKE